MTMIRSAAILGTSVLALWAGAALAENEIHIEDVAFAHEGPFGSFDQNQLQRGLQVYTEACAACHGLKFVPIRTLADEGGPHLPEDQVRAYAAAFPINDEASNPQFLNAETGEYKVLEASDNFPANHAQGAPDLSLMTKARAGFHGPYGSGINQLFKGIGGPEYVHGVLTGYVDPPACATGDESGYYNKHFAKGGIPDSCKDEDGHYIIEGSWIAMPPPLSDDQVTYADGTAATVEQMSMDVTSFLTWAAEPKLMARKQAGLTAVIFLGVLATLLYLTNKRLWANIKGKKEHA
jgi:ubiquinol-cytochrome c reductase cytochrome c1 subunit